MGHLYLVRHGQASLGADDYDVLSELGVRQARRLGHYFAERRLEFAAVLTGTLRRHAQTWAAIADGAGYPNTALAWPGLNEYDSEAVIRAVHPAPLPRPTTRDAYREHFRLLRAGLRAWMDGNAAPEGMPGWPDFERGVTGALDHIRRAHAGDNNVLLVSSGGPIATAVGHVLGCPPETTIELNLRIRNSALTEFVFTSKRHALLSFNHLPHLDGAEYADWVSYA